MTEFVDARARLREHQRAMTFKHRRFDFGLRRVALFQ
jgi:hypothetical protein